MVGVVAGILLVCPLAIQAVAKIAARVPVAARLALRDLSRYRARSGAALAAIASLLGMAVTVVAAAGAARNDIGPGNLSSTQVLLRGSDLELLTLPDVSAVTALQQGADAIAAVLPGATATLLEVAVDPLAETDPRVPGNAPVGLARPSGDRSYEEVGAVFVAIPSLLAAYGLDPSDLAGRDVVTSETGALRLLWTGAPRSSTASPVRRSSRRAGYPTASRRCLGCS